MTEQVKAWPVSSDHLGLLTVGDHPVRIVHDGWRGRDRVFRYTGPCVVCGRKTWSFDDGENDPRGMLGDHALWITTGEEESVEIRTCSICANEEPAYRAALRIAKERGTLAVAPYVDGKRVRG